jgi:uncharacterized protein (TIGR03437 family)
MNFRHTTSLMISLMGLSAAPMLAQTSIGSVTCTSSNLNGIYEISLSGRQVTSGGAISKLFESVGTATFDGLSKVTLNLTANSVNGSQSFGTPLVYAGTYSVQSNCEGSINITSGDTAAFSVSVYSVDTTTGQGRSLYMIGSDANYAYNGNGTVATATCPVSSLSGTYPFNATGNSLSGGSVTGAVVVLGVLQMDGLGDITASWTAYSNTATGTVTAMGTYSLTSTCLGTASVTDSSGNKYTVSMSLDGTTPNFVFAVAAPNAVFLGTARRQIATGTASCTAAYLSGNYELTLAGRMLTTAGITTKLFQANGTASFDGVSKVTLTMTANTVNGSQAFGTPLVYSGTYTLSPTCAGTIVISTGGTETFQIEAFSINAATQHSGAFQIIGTDANFVYNGGGNTVPAACATSTLSGAWPFLATGNTLSGGTDSGTVDVAGLLQFDGQGNVSASWTASTNTATTAVTATGTYTLSNACLGSATITDTNSNKYTITMSAYGATSGDVAIVVANPQMLFSGTAPVVSTNPALAVVNAASSAASATPPGSIFTIYGTNLATKETQATSVPLPTTVLTTTVTVNGEAAPIFYANTGQINAQMPEDVAPGLATVIVKNGTSTSNAVAVTVPAAGTPGIFVYGQNRAVVVNQDGSVNSPTTPAKSGTVLVAYFTGGGPVQGGGSLKSGSATPGSLFPLSGTSSVTVDGKAATVNYIGLTPGSIGLYQVNFVLPTLATGDRALVITVAGQTSNNPLVAVTN